MFRDPFHDRKIATRFARDQRWTPRISATHANPTLPPRVTRLAPPPPTAKFGSRNSLAWNILRDKYGWNLSEFIGRLNRLTSRTPLETRTIQVINFNFLHSEWRGEEEDLQFDSIYFLIVSLWDWSRRIDRVAKVIWRKEIRVLLNMFCF